jgi:hypothetical protein
MRKSLSRRPSPALVISIIALVVAMGGTAYAGFSIPKNSVGSTQLKNGAVTTKKIKKGTVTASKINTKGLTVPNALHASGASTAGSATSAADANALQGHSASSFAPSAIEAAQQPAYANGWQGCTSSIGPCGDDEALSFFEDPWGIVHLQGAAANSTATTGPIFTLPSGYRPAGNLWLAVYGNGQTPAYIEIQSDGTVSLVGDSQLYVGLTGVTFRAGL